MHWGSGRTTLKPTQNQRESENATEVRFWPENSFSSLLHILGISESSKRSSHHLIRTRREVPGKDKHAPKQLYGWNKSTAPNHTLQILKIIKQGLFWNNPDHNWKGWWRRQEANGGCVWIRTRWPIYCEPCDLEQFLITTTTRLGSYLSQQVNCF